MHPDPVIIAVAINGGVTPDRNPHVPLLAAEITQDCLRCFEAGATVHECASLHAGFIHCNRRKSEMTHGETRQA